MQFNQEVCKNTHEILISFGEYISEVIVIERLEFETVPAQLDGRDCHKMWNKINEIIDYINNEVEKRPKVLYGIENIHTGEITFNARGGAYQDKNAAYRKMAELGVKEHRLVEYKLESKGE